MARRGWRPDGEPRPVSDSLDRVAKRLSRADAGAMATWSDRWAELAGDAVAAASAPTKVLDGVLTVRCDAPVWATQLRLTWPEVQARARALGLEVPGRLEVVVRPR